MDYGLEMLTRPAWIEVDLAALRENFAKLVPVRGVAKEKLLRVGCGVFCTVSLLSYFIVVKTRVPF